MDSRISHPILTEKFI